MATEKPQPDQEPDGLVQAYLEAEAQDKQPQQAKKQAQQSGAPDEKVPPSFWRVTRLGFFAGLLVSSCLSPMLGSIVLLMKNPASDISIESAKFEARSCGTLFFAGFCIFLIYHRFKNIGWSGWYSLLMFVPFVNLGLIAFCLVPQEGFAKQQKRQLDTIGIINLLFFIALLAAIAIYFLTTWIS